MRALSGPHFFVPPHSGPLVKTPSLPWPLPALAAWALAWGLFAALRAAGSEPGPAAAVSALAGAALAQTVHQPWRRWIVALGFPLSAVALGLAASVPPWAWALAALPLLVAYPLRAWRDAPFYPTAADALQGLDAHVTLAPGAHVLDAGCGMGHGLQALRAVWPEAALHGVEWSRPLAWIARARCPWAQVSRGDMWAGDWSQLDLLYLFQRPESMPRAAEKARREMRAGSWFVSLEFEVPGWQPQAQLQAPGKRKVWVYRIS